MAIGASPDGLKRKERTRTTRISHDHATSRPRAASSRAALRNALRSRMSFSASSALGAKSSRAFPRYPRMGESKRVQGLTVTFLAYGPKAGNVLPPILTAHMPFRLGVFTFEPSDEFGDRLHRFDRAD